MDFSVEKTVIGIPANNSFGYIYVIVFDNDNDCTLNVRSCQHYRSFIILLNHAIN